MSELDKEMKFGENIAMDHVRSGRMKIPYEDYCYDCHRYKIGNILNDRKLKKSIFICGDCFNKRVKGSE